VCTFSQTLTQTQFTVLHIGPQSLTGILIEMSHTVTYIYAQTLTGIAQTPTAHARSIQLLLLGRGEFGPLDSI
jgi:hypothetical protein